MAASAMSPRSTAAASRPPPQRRPGPGISRSSPPAAAETVSFTVIDATTTKVLDLPWTGYVSGSASADPETCYTAAATNPSLGTKNEP